MSDRKVKHSFLPWQDLMRIGMGHLKLSPQQFWSATPKELKAAIEGALGRELNKELSRDMLSGLMKRYPDIKQRSQDNE